jgi:DNA-binding transcriptional ArsR family regulator
MSAIGSVISRPHLAIDDRGLKSERSRGRVFDLLHSTSSENTDTPLPSAQGDSHRNDSTPTYRSKRALDESAKNGILNHMVQYDAQEFDASFAALSDATRRGVLERLAREDASITELADTFQMTLTGMKKHVSVLEHAGLVVTEKVGRVRRCRLGPSRLEQEAAWIEHYGQLWAARFDELDKVVEDLKHKENANGRKK